MPERETVFSSRIKYNGVFNFQEFYKFCHDWLTQETGLKLSEDKYAEQITGDSKKIDIIWTGKKMITDYFRFDTTIKMQIIGLTKVEISQGGVKTSTNKGSIEVQISSETVRDYKGNFEVNAYKKFLRSIYEKWVIPARIEEFNGRITTESDEFLSQAKAYLDLEGKK